MIILTGQTVKVHNLKNFIMTIFIQRKICSTSNIPVFKIFWLQYSMVVNFKLTLSNCFQHTEDNSHMNQCLQA